MGAWVRLAGVNDAVGPKCYISKNKPQVRALVIAAKRLIKELGKGSKEMGCLKRERRGK